MGGCATKPKDLKADTEVAPAPAPAKDEDSGTGTGTGTETNEVVGVDGDKSRSLSNLFKESEEGKGLTENDKAQSEPVKEEACEAGKATDVSETKTPEVENFETLAEQISTPIIDAPVKVEAEKEIEVEPATETQKYEPAVEKKGEEHEQDVEIPKPESLKKIVEKDKMATDIKIPESPEEKKIEDEQSVEITKSISEEEKPVTETQKAPEENTTEK